MPYAWLITVVYWLIMSTLVAWICAHTMRLGFKVILLVFLVPVLALILCKVGYELNFLHVEYIPWENGERG